MRKKIAAGNWKMNLEFDEAINLVTALQNGQFDSEIEMILGVPFVYLKSIADLLNGSDNISIAAQNCSPHAKGAFTGETSISMLKSIQVNTVIVGHSERRHLFNESNELLKEKVDALLSESLTPIFCFGEPLSVREDAKHEGFVEDQLKSSIFHLSEAEFSKLILAYEPIWAIGTGKTASPQQAQDMHAFIRNLISKKYNSELAESVSILYGGSVKPKNAKELFANKDVDGGLVGGASLKSEDFLAIANSF